MQKGLFVSQLYPFGNQYGDIALPNDMEDFSSPEIKLQTPINFFQRQYQSIFVNENGLLSFLTEIPSFFNFEFPSLDYPIIAILYSDVDCRGSLVMNRLTEFIFQSGTPRPNRVIGSTQ